MRAPGRGGKGGRESTNMLFSVGYLLIRRLVGGTVAVADNPNSRKKNQLINKSSSLTV